MALEKSPPIPNVEERHEAYSYFLSNLTLDSKHNEHLIHKRLLTNNDIERVGYKTLPAFNKSIEIMEIVDGIKENINLSMIPGFYKRSDNGKWTAKQYGETGLIIPIRNENEKIVGLRLRMERSTGKYLPFSSVHEECGTSLRTGKMIYWPNINRERIKEHATIRITEGEFKAEIATLDTPIYTIGLLGVATISTILEEYSKLFKSLGIKEILLCFDSDRDFTSYDTDGKTVGQYLAEAYNKLYIENKIHPVIEYWTEKSLKGIDDLLADSELSLDPVGNPLPAYSNLLKMTDDEAKDWVIEHCGELSTSNWALLVNGNQCDIIDLRDLRRKHESIVDRKNLDNPNSKEYEHPVKRYTKAEFNAAFRHLGNKDSHDLICMKKDLIKIDFEDYFPNQPVIIKQGGKQILNHWKHYPLEPIQGDVEWFFNHLKQIMPDIEEASDPCFERNMFIGYMMSFIARPEILLLSMPISFSEVEGTGKTSLYKHIIGRILGGNYKQASPKEMGAVTGFNSFLSNASLIMFDEIYTEDKTSVTTFLNNLITSDIVSIEEKFQKAQSRRRTFNVAATTNHANALKIADEARRFRFFSFSNPFGRNKEKNYDYWKAFMENINRQELSALYYHALNHYNFDWFDIVQKGKNDTHTTRMVFDSIKSYAVNDLDDSIQMENFPFNMDVAYVPGIITYFHDNNKKRLVTSKQNFAKLLERNGYTKERIRYYPSIGGKQKEITLHYKNGYDSVLCGKKVTEYEDKKELVDAYNREFREKGFIL